MVNNDFIQYILFGEVVENKRLNTSITEAINSLSEKSLIDIIAVSGKGKNANYIISNEEVLVDSSKDIYTYIGIDWIKKVSDVKLLQVLMAITSSFNNFSRVGYNSIDNYCRDYNIAKNTFLRHTK